MNGEQEQPQVEQVSIPLPDVVVLALKHIGEVMKNSPEEDQEANIAAFSQIQGILLSQHKVIMNTQGMLQMVNRVLGGILKASDGKIFIPNSILESLQDTDQMQIQPVDEGVVVAFVSNTPPKLFVPPKPQIIVPGGRKV